MSGIIFLVNICWIPPWRDVGLQTERLCHGRLGGKLAWAMEPPWQGQYRSRADSQVNRVKKNNTRNAHARLYSESREVPSQYLRHSVSTGFAHARK